MRWWKKLWGNSDNAIKVARQSADISPDTTNSPSLSSVLSMPIDLPTETINLLTPHVDPIEAPVQPIPKGPLDGYPAPYSKGSHGETLLHLAAKEGDIDLAKALIENADMTALQWMQYINSKNSLGETALHYAAKYDNSDILLMLLEFRANSNIKNILGDTPLHVSSGNGNCKSIQILIQSGADTKSKDNTGISSFLQSSCIWKNRSYRNSLGQWSRY